MEKMNEFESLNKLYALKKRTCQVLNEKYDETLKPFIELIKIVKRANKISTFSAVGKLIDAGLVDTDHQRIIFWCAALEVIEEDEAKQKEKTRNDNSLIAECKKIIGTIEDGNATHKKIKK